ncbi:sigma-70 family RNA polymerase sigma factor [Hymenobacter sp. BT507]|uniref:Sigma-70 family RNA polymerase sigma factor n=1 Tax=Hymenobacter citatus TaxID=2763506 RepID=A0ABR7MEJ8_9BACT|nr:sigma-70 family RNA polymerase sigma factor [Hymenobacter citatus]MBC6609471.1 sigma-70 family RNA polymerase sigma factor [Hymenobacter citatus]
MPSPEEVLVLWNLFKQGDWSAYTALYDQHFTPLNNYGYKFTKNVTLIEDAIQDLFIGLWTNRQNLSTPVSVKNYLYKSLRNILLRKAQNQSRFVEISDDNSIPFEVSFDQYIIVGEEEKELRTKVNFFLTKLPPRQQEIIFLRFYEDFDYQEIADIMGITVSSAYKLLYKALHSMEVALNK